MKICRSETLRQGPTRRNGRAETSYQAALRGGDLSLCADIRMLLKIILGRLRAAPAVRFRQSVPVTDILGRSRDGRETRGRRGFAPCSSRRPTAQRAPACAPARVALAPAHTHARVLGRGTCRCMSLL